MTTPTRYETQDARAKLPAYVDLPPVVQMAVFEALGNTGSAFGVHERVRGPIGETVWNALRAYLLTAMQSYAREYAAPLIEAARVETIEECAKEADGHWAVNGHLYEDSEGDPEYGYAAAECRSIATAIRAKATRHD